MFNSGNARQSTDARRSKSRPSAFLTIVVLLIVAVWQANRAPQIAPAPHPRPAPADTPAPPKSEEIVRVVRVVDGDTLLLEQRVRVRLLGVNCPEIAHDDQPAELLGKEAAEFTRQFLAGKTVTLEYDSERVDDYGRTLAYVYADGQMLNESLIEAGLSEAVTRHPYRSDRKTLFEEAEERAFAKRRGIWSQPGRAPR